MSMFSRNLIYNLMNGSNVLILNLFLFYFHYRDYGYHLQFYYHINNELIMGKYPKLARICYISKYCYYMSMFSRNLCFWINETDWYYYSYMNIQFFVSHLFHFIILYMINNVYFNW